MRTILTLALTLGLVATAGLAQPGSQPGSQPGPQSGFGPPGSVGPHDGRPFGPEAMEAVEARRLDVLSEYLALSDAQRYEVEALFANGRERRREAFDEMRQTAEELRLALEADSPDPTRVGELVIALHRGKESLEEERLAERDSVAALLTPEQRERYEALETARDLAPRPFGPRHPRRPGRHAPPPSPATPGAR